MRWSKPCLGIDRVSVAVYFSSWRSGGVMRLARKNWPPHVKKRKEIKEKKTHAAVNWDQMVASKRAKQQTNSATDFFCLLSCAMEPTTRLHERNKQFGQI